MASGLRVTIFYPVRPARNFALVQRCPRFPNAAAGQLPRRNGSAPRPNGRNLEKETGLPGQRPAWRDAGPAALLLAMGFFGLVATTVSPWGENGQYAVIVPAGHNAGRAIMLVQRAGGRVAAITPGSHIVIAHSERPRFEQDLYRAGAWLVVDPMRLRGCGKAPSSIPKETA